MIYDCHGQDDRRGVSAVPESTRKEMEELKDRNTALEQQIQEHTQTIFDQRKVREESDSL